MSRASIAWLLGLGFFFLGERSFGSGSSRWILDGIGVALLAASLWQRFRAVGQARFPVMAKGWRMAFRFSFIALLFLPLYLLASDEVVDLIGLGAEAERRWQAILGAAAPIALLLGTIPALQLDHALSSSVLVPAQRLQHEVESGLILALGLCLTVPLNFVASHLNEVWDVTYFRTTEAGESTRSLVDSLEEPVVATLFFAPSDEVLAEIRPYFEGLAGGELEVRVVDQAVDRALAEGLRIRRNGWIVFQRGEQSEKFDLGTELDRAKDDLEELDSKVNKALIGLVQGERIAYFTVGHGEFHRREEDDQRKLDILHREIEGLGFRIKNLGVVEGLGDSIPEDADVVIIPAPETEFHPAEVQALSRYLDDGGSLLVMLEPGGAHLDDLLARAGVKFVDEVLVADAHFLATGGGLSDREIQGTNRFGSHPSVTTLSRNSRILGMLLPTMGRLEELRDGGARVSTTVRSMPDTWNDVVRNHEFDADQESRKAHEVAIAATSDEDDGFRAAVIADATFASDWALRRNQANILYIRESLLWLVEEEALVGEVASEEDVLIQHNQAEDRLWFFGSIFGVPLLVGALGSMRLRQRRKLR